MPRRAFCQRTRGDPAEGRYFGVHLYIRVFVPSFCSRRRCSLGRPLCRSGVVRGRSASSPTSTEAPRQNTEQGGREDNSPKGRNRDRPTVQEGRRRYFP